MRRRAPATRAKAQRHLLGLLLLAGCAASAESGRDASGERPTQAEASADIAATGTDGGPDVAATSRDADTASPEAAPDLPAEATAEATPDASSPDADAAEALGPRDTAPEAAPVEVPICSGACTSATPRNPTVDGNGGTGNVTMYTTEASDGGACNYGTTSVRYFAAVNVNVSPGDGKGQWNGGRICGQCAEITAITSQGPKSVVVRIMDRCPDVSCGMDLGGQAPATIMTDGFGRYDGSWRFVACSGHPEVSDGTPSLFVVAGSNAWWSRIQVRNPPWAVSAMAWKDPSGAAAGTFAFAADPENTYEVPTTVLQSTAAALLVTVTYADGSTATAQLAPSAFAAGGSSYPLE